MPSTSCYSLLPKLPPDDNSPGKNHEACSSRPIFDMAFKDSHLQPVDFSHGRDRKNITTLANVHCASRTVPVHSCPATATHPQADCRAGKLPSRDPSLHGPRT